MKIHRPNPQSLIVSQSRLLSIVILSIYWAAIGGASWVLFALGTISEGTNLFEHIKDRLSTSPLSWVAILGLVVFLPAMYKELKIIAVGEWLFFDGFMRTISIYKKPVAKFDEVAHLEVRTIESEGDAHHYLTAVLRYGKKIKIHDCADSDWIIALADDVADIMKVSVIHKK